MVDVIREQDVIWKKYPEYPFIEANQFGEIRTIDRYVPVKSGGKRLIKGHILKQWQIRGGYLSAHFKTGGKLVNLLVHRIVATCFIPNHLGLPEVNHIDCDRTNNLASNLEWVTHKENMAYCIKLGRFVNNALKKPVIAINLETLKVFCFESQSEASRQLGVSQGNISDVLKGRQNKTRNYWFCFVGENAIENVRVKFGNDVARKVEELMRNK